MAASVEKLVPHLSVSDMERSLAFYRDGLGFEMTQSWKPQDRILWCWLKRGGAELMLGQHDSGALLQNPAPGAAYYFICGDAAALREELLSRGLKPGKAFVAFYGMKQVNIKDPDGYDLWFESATNEPPTPEEEDDA